MDFAEKIKAAPEKAGVYLMKDSAGKIIYIGKAKSLRKRLVSYLSRDLSAKTISMLSKVCDIEYIPAADESLALLLESNLIHRYQPKYNILLRDDKSFPFVKITNEDFPAIYITRKKEPDGSHYLGPYTDVKLLRRALKIIRRYFPYRSCKKLPKHACIYYRLKLSPAPCIGKITKEEYAQTIQEISLLLEGNTDGLIKELSAVMFKKAEARQFEEAAKIRDKIQVLSSIGMHGRLASHEEEVESLRQLLGIRGSPERIEAFDISNIHGKEAVGSMVSFYHGVADRNNYRRFRIKTVYSIDDYAMLREVVHRRYARILKEKLPLPDLIIIDGGKAHLIAADTQLQALGIQLPIISIAKDRENIYIKGRHEAVNFKEGAPALNLIRRIRDEAHRFAVSYHRILRRKKTIGK
ncbi:MAG: excinuclease ABC subunit UvrC [Candidatus Omnitrophica bacterium]|nr:excinuclease ABC subunit UvrC [Candidatus Omnitrophota bacterium]